MVREREWRMGIICASLCYSFSSAVFTRVVSLFDFPLHFFSLPYLTRCAFSAFCVRTVCNNLFPLHTHTFSHIDPFWVFYAAVTCTSTDI